ncbi:MAG TPA: acyltransferase [Candidatus Acidoferrales bacterium]|jgi:peptidoglycan/LPS O-acetylase OafA/YrhL|nr:acyltransferase [Candidatus Acidoferrales bacterium]
MVVKSRTHPDTLVQTVTSRQCVTSRRIPGVDGLRGLAVISVLLYHFKLFAVSSGSALWERLYAGAAGIGWAGVDLFFVLSGFLITSILLQSVGNENYYRVFYFRRTVRIFPLYYASLLLFFVLAPWALGLMHHGDAVRRLIEPRRPIQPSFQFFAWLYLLNWRSGLYSFAAVPTVIHHFWSLSIEEQFYFVWPFVVRTAKRGWLMIVCLALVAVSFTLRVIFHRMQMGVAAYVLTFCRLDSLAIGGIVALSFRDPRYWSMARKAALPLTAFALGALIVLMGMTGSVAPGDVWMGTVGISLWGLFFGGLLVMVLAAQEGGLVHRASSARPLQFFGKYSYCLYIIHQPLILALVYSGINSDNLARILGNKVLAVAAVNGIALLLVVLIALASWHLFEKHFLKLKELFPSGEPAR